MQMKEEFVETSRVREEVLDEVLVGMQDSVLSDYSVAPVTATKSFISQHLSDTSGATSGATQVLAYE